MKTMLDFIMLITNEENNNSPSLLSFYTSAHSIFFIIP